MLSRSIDVFGKAFFVFRFRVRDRTLGFDASSATNVRRKRNRGSPVLERDGSSRMTKQYFKKESQRENFERKRNSKPWLKDDFDNYEYKYF